MKNLVVIKSYNNGLNLYLDNEVSFEELLYNVALKFRESSKFFGDSKLSLLLTGRELTMQEELQIIEEINNNSDITITCLVGKENGATAEYFNKLNILSKEIELNCATIHNGSLINTQVLEDKNSILVLGDVYQGCSITSNRNIIVLGGIYGDVHAGATGNDDAYVFALDLSPDNLTINNSSLLQSKKNHFWGIKTKYEPKIALIENGIVQVKPHLKEVWESYVKEL